MELPSAVMVMKNQVSSTPCAATSPIGSHRILGATECQHRMAIALSEEPRFHSAVNFFLASVFQNLFSNVTVGQFCKNGRNGVWSRVQISEKNRDGMGHCLGCKSFTRTHTHKHTHTNTHTHTRNQGLTTAGENLQRHRVTHTHTRHHTHPPTNPPTHQPTHPPTHPHTHTRTHTHDTTPTHPHTHTHTTYTHASGQTAGRTAGKVVAF